jgi:hypothetical protein
MEPWSAVDAYDEGRGGRVFERIKNEPWMEDL